jgi:hypothetical protein
VCYREGAINDSEKFVDSVWLEKTGVLMDSVEMDVRNMTALASSRLRFVKLNTVCEASSRATG